MCYVLDIAKMNNGNKRELKGEVLRFLCRSRLGTLCQPESLNPKL